MGQLQCCQSGHHSDRVVLDTGGQDDAPQKQKGWLDRYNIYVLALGHFFHLVWGTEEINDWIFGFMGALAVELVVWEMLGNSDYVVTRIRDDEEMYQGGTIGDSVRSVLSDLACCGLGYFLSAVFLSLEMIWLSGLWIAASEVFCILWLKDSLVLTLVRMLLPRDLAVIKTDKHHDNHTNILYSLWSTNKQ